MAVMFFMHLWAEKRASCCLWCSSRFLCCCRCSSGGLTVSGSSTVADTVRECAGASWFAVQEKPDRQGREANFEDHELKKALPIRPTLMVLAALVLLASPLPAMAQSCALCYTQAASAGTRMIDALKSGILILIVPPTLMSIAMVVHYVSQSDPVPGRGRYAGL